MNRIPSLLVPLCVAICAQPALAGPLNGDPAAILSNSFPIPFVPDSTGLSGTLDSAVYTSAAFRAEFGGSGYTPTPGEFVYTYQVSLDSSSVSSSLLAVPIFIIFSAGVSPSSANQGTSAVDPPFVDNIGTFALGGGQTPSSTFFGEDQFTPSVGNPAPLRTEYAHFVFDNPLPAGAASSGLVFCSPAGPLGIYPAFVNGPSGYTMTLGWIAGAIPEPSTIVLAILGGLTLLAYRRQR